VKLHLASLTVACLTLVAIPAIAQQDLYDNGPVNGQVDAWIINSGYAVSETFHLSNSATPQSLSFWAWVDPGDLAISVELAIGDTGYFSNNLDDELVSLTQSNCFTNNLGFDVCQETANLFFVPTLNAGNYYLTLNNAATVNGGPVFWDENSGVGCQSNGCPSSAQEVAFGTIPSEAFTLSGAPTTSGTTPEPGSILLFASGAIALAAVLRRRLF
jgi:hypothetical protein